jgi:caffeoyl-CoA O-methyltransferase
VKTATEALLRADQAGYLDGLHAKSVHALAALAGLGGRSRVEGRDGRDPLLAKMEERAASQGYPISDPEVACFLSIVARLAAPRLVVELGTNIGYGAIVLARAGGAESRVVTIESSADLAREARAYIAEAGLSDRIEVRHGTAIGELEKMGEPIDLLYVDCVKEEYPRYLELAMPKLSARGVIVADNVLWRGDTARVAGGAAPTVGSDAKPKALDAFNQALVSRPDLCGVVLPLGDGVGFAIRVSSSVSSSVA